MFGGSCRTAPRIETGHIFKTIGTHATAQEKLLYNKMMVATLLLDDYQRLIDFLGTNETVEKAKKLYIENIDLIMMKKEEYKKKTVYSYLDFFKRFDIDYRL